MTRASRRLARPVLALMCSSVCLVALHVGAPARAFACGGPECAEAEFFPARGSVPANLPAVLFWPPARWKDGAIAGPDSVAAGDVRFVRLDAAGPVDVEFELIESDEPSTRLWAGGHGAPAYRILPKSELKSGARYAVWSKDCTGKLAADPPREPYVTPESSDDDVGGVPVPRAPYAVFDVTTAAELPSALGRPRLFSARQRMVQVPEGSGCFELVEAASVVAELDRSDNPFYDAIAFSTFVDGKGYRPSTHNNYAPTYGDSWIGHGRDELVAICGAATYHLLTQGKHLVRFEGRVAGTDVLLVSESVELNLACAAASDAGSSDAGDSSSQAGHDDDAGTSDVSDASSRASRDDAGSPDASDSSSRARRDELSFADGCSLTSDANGGALAMLLALAVLRRRFSAGSRSRAGSRAS